MNKQEHNADLINWFTISEIVRQHGVSRHKVVYWLDNLKARGLARKTGPNRHDPWLIHANAIEHLATVHAPGRKPLSVNADECELWRTAWSKHRSVDGVARSFGVCWQTAARRLDLCGIRHYTKRGD